MADEDAGQEEELLTVQKPSKDVGQCDEALVDSETSWDSMGLDMRLLKAIARVGYKNPTLIQSKAIPLALQGKDILAKARTGSGKTAAYLLPILQTVITQKESRAEAKEDSVKAVILVPTRELCEQVRQVVDTLAHYCSKLVRCVQLSGTGGSGMQSQKVLLAEKPDIVVATPSRLVEHLKLKNLVIKSSLQVIVIDEADLILSYGYEADVRSITEHLPKRCQGCLMSATLNPEVEGLKQLVLHTPAILKLNDDAVKKADTLKQYTLQCSETDKFLIAYVLIRLNLLPGKTLFFVNSIEKGYQFRIFLEHFSLKAAVLNSELPHNSRQHILQEFNKGIFDYLIAADEQQEPAADAEDAGEGEDEGAQQGSDEEEQSKKKRKKVRKDAEFGVARGVDFKGVQAVINFDFPLNALSYTHRIGRTARGGEVGMALSFVAPGDEEALAEVQQFQSAEGKEVKPFEFKMALVEGFRYRVEDTLRSVSRRVIKEARLNELKMEIINSERLKAHFEDNPKDLQLLRHDRGLTNQRPAEHLKHIPFYLMPSKKSQHAQSKKRTGGSGSGAPGNKKQKKKKNDPLRSFAYDEGASEGGAERAQRDVNEIQLAEDGEEDEGEAEERDLTKEEIRDMDEGFKWAHGKKQMKDRKLKYMRGKGRKETITRIKNQLREAEAGGGGDSD